MSETVITFRLQVNAIVKPHLLQCLTRSQKQKAWTSAVPPISMLRIRCWRVASESSSGIGPRNADAARETLQKMNHETSQWFLLLFQLCAGQWVLLQTSPRRSKKEVTGVYSRKTKLKMCRAWGTRAEERRWHAERLSAFFFLAAPRRMAAWHNLIDRVTVMYSQA